MRQRVVETPCSLLTSARSLKQKLPLLLLQAVEFKRPVYEAAFQVFEPLLR